MTEKPVENLDEKKEVKKAAKKKTKKTKKKTTKKKVTKKKINEVQTEVKKIAKSKTFKNRIGRPPTFGSVEEFDEMINAYFEYCDRKKEPYTVTGLARAIGVTRTTLLAYKERPEFLYSVNQALLIVEDFNEKRLYGTHTTGVQFNLTNNFGWKNSMSVDAKVASKLEDILCEDDLPALD